MPSFVEFWPHLVWVLTLLVSILASGHALMNKREVRAAAGWVGIIWLAPVLGAVLYLLLGVNRIRRRAAALNRKVTHPMPRYRLPVATVQAVLGASGTHLGSLVRLVDEVVPRPLVAGNRITALVNGDAAYPAMIEAIDAAEHSVTLCTYIFDRDAAGYRFVHALARAVERGVLVRVLVDAVGLRYSFPGVHHVLRRAGVPTARFLPVRIPWRMNYMNLRTHRKIMVVDGTLGFTGGMNIRAGHVLGADPAHPIQDLHFRVEGPAVRQLQGVFAEDWQFTTSERLEGEAFYPKIPEVGRTLARAISDGPDEDLDVLRWTLLGALATAARSVRIVTPYFLPDLDIVTALNVAALRGVEVDIVLPKVNNLTLVHWAAMSTLPHVAEHGCRIHFSPPPFDHTKLMVVDRTWALVGSGNWDPRTLRLNFELDVECYDPELASQLDELVQAKIAHSEHVTLAQLEARPTAIKLRDAVVHLMQPYL